MRGKAFTRAAYQTVRPSGGFDPSPIGSVGDDGEPLALSSSEGANLEGGADDQVGLRPIPIEDPEDAILLICWGIKTDMAQGVAAFHPDALHGDAAPLGIQAATELEADK